MHNTEAVNARQDAPKPTLDYVEVQRKHRLVRVIRDARRVLDHGGEPASPELSRLITLAVAEIAAISRMVDVNERAGEWMEMVADALSVGVWDAEPLWHHHAATPIQAEALRWRQHQQQAARLAEPAKFFHVRLVRAEDIAAALNLTRARIRDVFGGDKCTLPPVKVLDHRFTAEERAQIRDLAERSGYSKKWIKELALRDDGGIAFCDLFLKFELKILEAKVLNRHRVGLVRSTDTALTQHIRYFKLHRKPGPKPRRDSIELQVASLASKKGWSISKTYRKIAAEKAAALRNVTPENVELPVTMTVSSCHDDSEFARSATSTFRGVFTPGVWCSSSQRDTPRDTFEECEYTDTELAIGVVATTCKRSFQKRRKYNPDDLDILSRWYAAETGRTLTQENCRQWNRRGIYDGHLNTARRWQANQEVFARELAADAAFEHASQHRVEIENDDDAIRPVRGPDAHLAEAPRPGSKAEGDSDGRR